ncbi:hypothetical protein C8Q73DRAFT_743544 [Cubamyces lactineus]|nr:hypothetical protein C8Q73DRAFT_743544 [Cubamyces lactineus]
MSESLYVMDDSNLQSINYETLDLWFPQTVSSDEAFEGTLTSGIAGAKASLTFSGSAIAVFGIATTVEGANPPAVQFAIDKSLTVTTTAPNNGSRDFEFPFLDVEDLSSAQHSLEITVLNATKAYPFALDFVAYLPISGATPTASQRIITSFLPAPTASVPVSSTKSSGAPVGAIVGGVIGGVALLVAVGLAVYFLCFRRRSNGQAFFYATPAKAGDLLDQEAKPTPYEVPPPSTPGFGAQSRYSAAPTSAPSAYSAAPSAYAAPLPYNAPVGASEAPVSEYSAGTSTSGPSHPPSLYVVTNVAPPRDSPNQPRSKAAEAGLLSVPQPATYHADSGIRFNSAGEPSSSSNAATTSQVLAAQELADVPPSYSEA